MNLLEALGDHKSGYAVIEPTHHDAASIDFIESDTEPTLEFLQKAVGGYIEHVTLRYIVDDVYGDENKEIEAHVPQQYEADGVVNEEGKLNGLPFNAFATMWYGNPEDVIVGPMVVMVGAARMK